MYGSRCVRYANLDNLEVRVRKWTSFSSPPKNMLIYEVFLSPVLSSPRGGFGVRQLRPWSRDCRCRDNLPRDVNAPIPKSRIWLTGVAGPAVFRSKFLGTVYSLGNNGVKTSLATPDCLHISGILRIILIIYVLKITYKRTYSYIWGCDQGQLSKLQGHSSDFGWSHRDTIIFPNVAMTIWCYWVSETIRIAGKVVFEYCIRRQSYVFTFAFTANDLLKFMFTRARTFQGFEPSLANTTPSFKRQNIILLRNWFEHLGRVTKLWCNISLPYLIFLNAALLKTDMLHLERSGRRSSMWQLRQHMLPKSQVKWRIWNVHNTQDSQLSCL